MYIYFSLSSLSLCVCVCACVRAHVFVNLWTKPNFPKKSISGQKKTENVNTIIEFCIFELV